MTMPQAEPVLPIKLDALLAKWKVTDPAEATHFCMNGTMGGKFRIPEEHYKHFYNVYFDHIDHKNPTYLTERAANTPYFHFFLDIDFRYNYELPNVDKMWKLIMSEVPNHEGYVISSRNKYKYHVNFPKAITTKSTAERIAMNICTTLEKNLPVFTLSGTPVKWFKSIVDTSVYSTGLRMLGAKKSNKIGKGKKSEVELYKDLLTEYDAHDYDPPFGRNPSPSDLGTEYQVTYIDGTGEIIPPAIRKIDLELTSVRYGIPPPEELELTRVDGDEAELEVNVPLHNVEDINRSNSGKNLSKELRQQILPFITEYFHHQPSHIGNIKERTTKTRKTIVCVQLHEKYCHFLKDQHKNNNQYIIIAESSSGQLYMEQRCYDEVCYGKSYLSTKVPEKLELIIGDVFPNRKTKKQFQIPSGANDCVQELLNDSEPLQPVVPFAPNQASHGGEGHMCRSLTATFPKTQMLRRLDPCDGNLMNVNMCIHGMHCTCDTCQFRYPPTGYLALANDNIRQYFFNVVQIYGNVQGDVNIYYNGGPDPLCFIQDGFVLFPNDPILNNAFLNALGGTHNAMARFMFCLKKDEFRVDKPKKDCTWFAFDGTKWKADSDALSCYIFSGEFMGYFQKAAEHYRSLGDDKENQRKVAKIMQDLENIGSNVYQSHVIAQCAKIWYQAYPDFLQRINTKNICAFTNGVYDFDALEFRPGRPDDYLTLSTNLPYVPYDENDENVRLIMNFLKEILDKEAVLFYTLMVLGTCLTTDISQQKFFMFTGEGSNGKSLLMSLLSECMGDYFGIANSSLITKPRESANSANEALASLRHVRLVMINEINSKDVIQADTMKMLTGGDSITTRENYGKQFSFQPTFKTILVCNNRPDLSENGYSEWRRVRVVHFPNKFVDNPDPDKRNEKKIDYDLKKKLAKALPAMLSILVANYESYKKQGGLVEPKEVTSHTKLYQDQNDKIKAFVYQHIEKCEGEVLCSKDLYAIFDVWHRAEYQKQPPGRNTFLNYIAKEVFGGVTTTNIYLSKDQQERLQKTQNQVQGWKGYRLKNV